ncbi:MAG: glycosyl transferase, partial [Mycobacterium sp.]|nr:glycosyl transferase [Mycobacterium sp.]
PGRGDVTPGAGMWGQSGITRMFQPAQGGQIAWLIPAALVVLVAGLLLAGKKPRTDAGRAQLVLWGGWLLGTGLVFSFMSGIFHQYYTVALAPAIAALVGMGATLLWRNRHLWWVRGSAAVAIGLSTATAWMLLGRSSDFLPWLRWTVLVGGVVATLGALPRWPKPAAGWIAALSAVIVLAGPVAYTVDTVVVGQGANGFIPSAGPRVANGFGNGGHGNPGGPGGLSGGGFPGGPMGGRGGAPGGPASPGMARQTGTAQHSPTRGGQHGPGGFMGSGKPSDQLVSMLKSHGSNYTWAAATMGSNSAAGYQLATGLPVMPIGGFNSTDPSPTLQQFQQDVAAGKIHYFLGGGQGGPFGGGNNSPNAAITQWVHQNFPAETVDNTTVYDLTTPITH